MAPAGKEYTVTLTGKMPMIHHHDNIGWADEMDAWRAVPANKKISKAGDDRSPAHRWLGSLYHDGEVVGVPLDNLMRCLMEGAAMVPVPGGRNGKTFKAQSQSGMLVQAAYWPLRVAAVKGGPSRTIPVEPLLALAGEPDFAKHQALAATLGFELFLKRARIGASKHIRVRPMFHQWSATGAVLVFDEQITRDVLASIFECAGLYKGLGDWRPSSKTPGPYGTFRADVQA